MNYPTIKFMKSLFYPREWFFIFMQVASAIAFVYAVVNPLSINYWFLSIIGYTLITCFGITMTFHRLLTHKSYILAKPLEYLFSYFGNLGCTGSSVGWVFVHRNHHKFADCLGDPHSPVVHGPIGAIIGDYGGKFNKWAVRDVINDPVHRFMHEYYMLLVGFSVIAIYLINADVMIYLLLIPIFLNTLASRLSNWIDHDASFGVKNSNDPKRDNSHNVWWWSYLTFGEGWHNNHHMYPGDFRIGKMWWQFDPGKYVIHLLMFLKLAKTNS